MKTARAAAILTAAMVMAGVKSSFALSDPVLINTSRSQGRRWKTVLTNDVHLQWDWCEDATSAKLEIVGMNSTFTTNFTEVTSNYLWRAFSGNTPSTEDVYDLTLTFYDSDSKIVESLDSQLAVVQGAFGKMEVISTSEETPWPKLNRNAIISYDVGWTATTTAAPEGQLVIAKQGGITQTNTLPDTAGYFGWKVNRSDWGYGTFNLSLNFPNMEDEWKGTLVRISEGMIILVR